MGNWDIQCSWQILLNISYTKKERKKENQGKAKQSGTNSV